MSQSIAKIVPALGAFFNAFPMGSEQRGGAFCFKPCALLPNLVVLKKREICMKLLLVITGFILGLSANSRTYTLTDNTSGSRFTCHPYGSGSSDMDPNCVKTVNTICTTETSFSDDDCFERSTSACKKGVNGNCVSDVYHECDTQTSYSSDDCFLRSLSACSGETDAIKDLMKGTKEKFKEDAKSRN